MLSTDILFIPKSRINVLIFDSLDNSPNPYYIPKSDKLFLEYNIKIFKILLLKKIKEYLKNFTMINLIQVALIFNI